MTINIKQVRTTSAEDIPDVDQLWLVDRLIPSTGLLILVGAAGVGKTTVAMKILADLTTGRLPVTDDETEQRSAFAFSMEETAIQLKRTAIRLGANLSRFNIAGLDQNAGNLTLDNTQEIAEMLAGGNVVMIDSFAAFEDRVSSETGAREALKSLAMAAEGRGLLILIHHAKRMAGNFIDRIANAKAIVRTGRHFLYVGAHPYREDLRLAQVAKSNIGPLGANVAFCPGPTFAWSKPVWNPEDDLLTPAPVTSTAKAVAYLEEMMQPGTAYPVQDIAAAAVQDGHSMKALRAACKYLGVEVIRDGFGSPCTWTLPHPNTITMPLFKEVV